MPKKRISLKYIEGWLRQYKIGTNLIQRFPLIFKSLNRYYLSKKYIKKGQGIEIGPSSFPLHISKKAKVWYVDILNERQLCGLYRDIPPEKMVKIDFIDDGEKLQGFKDGTLDFIIANHFIEHTVNPCRTIINFLRVLKKGGIIFLAVPNRVNTFDYLRPLTEVEHLIDVFEKDVDEFIDEHYLEIVRIVEKCREEDIHERVEKLKRDRFSVHYHTFQLENFVPLIEYLKSKGYPVRILDKKYIFFGTDEFVVILEKI